MRFFLILVFIVASAISCLGQILQIPKLDKADEQHIKRAQTLEKEGHLDEAIQIYTSLIDRNIGGWYVLEMRAAAAQRLRRWDDALADYSAMIRIYPELVPPRLNRANIYRAKKEYEKGLSDIDEAIRIKPRNFVAHRLKTSTLIDMEDLDKAERTLNTLFILSPKSAEARILKAVICSKRYQIACLLTESRKALELDSRSSAAHNNLAYALLLLERPGEALKHAERAIDLRPGWAYPANNRGLSFIMLKQWDKAFENIERALALDATLPEAYDNKGLLLLETGKTDEAIANFDKALLLSPKLASAYRNRGRAFFIKKDFTKSLSDLQRSLDIDPNSPVAYDIRADLLSATGQGSLALADREMARSIRSKFIP